MSLRSKWDVGLWDKETKQGTKDQAKMGNGWDWAKVNANRVMQSQCNCTVCVPSLEGSLRAGGVCSKV